MGCCCPGPAHGADRSATKKSAAKSSVATTKKPSRRRYSLNRKPTMATNWSSPAGTTLMKKNLAGKVKKSHTRKWKTAKALKKTSKSASNAITIKKNNKPSLQASSLKATQKKQGVLVSREIQSENFSDVFSSAFGVGKYSDTASSESSSASATGQLGICSQFRFSGRENPLSEYSDEEQKELMATRRLGRDQKLKACVVGGHPITTEKPVTKLITKQFVEKMRAQTNLPTDLALIAQPDFTTLHCIVPGVYLTGAFGLQREAMEEAYIKLVINATTELPLLNVKGLTTYRVPVEDDEAHRIDVYFDDVADLIEATRRSEYGSVVHCAAGVSRSSTLVLAYLVKYTTMTLKEAFGHTRAIRPVIRPNMGFLAQLVEYERKLRGSVSMYMMKFHDKNTGVTVTAPDFYPTECKAQFDWLVSKAASKEI